MKKMPLKKVQKRSAILLAIGMILSCIGAMTELLLPVCLGFLAWLGAGILGFLFYRCPHCNQFLSKAGGEYCPYCGKKLDQ